jgi:hypothetical protein
MRPLRAGPERVLEAVAPLLAATGLPLRVRGRGDGRPSFASSDDAVRDHFATRSDPGHVNFDSFLETLRLLGDRPSVILETGSSAWGTDSSRLFDRYVSSFGGEFWTVDNRLRPLLELRRVVSAHTTLCCGDSVRFLERWVRSNPARKADLVYLDSFDLDFAEPSPAGEHGLREFLAIRPALGPGSLLLIDDTPAADWIPPTELARAEAFRERTGMLPGKGMLVERDLEHEPAAVKVHHRYQLLYRFSGTPRLSG